MENIPQITVLQLAWAFFLILLMSWISALLRLQIGKGLIWSSARAMLQLIFLGHFLTFIFHYNNPYTFTLLILVAITMAAFTASRRVKLKVKSLFSSALFSLLVSTVLTGIYTLFLTIPQTPWYDLTSAIPLIGMIIGNSLSGISLALNNFYQEVSSERRKIEGLLAMGATPLEAMHPFIQRAFHSGLTPIFNSMSTVGLVSIPGMMTGQILGGSSPLNAAKYQINILLMITASTLLSILGVLFWNYRILFNIYGAFHEERLHEIEQGEIKNA